MLCIVSSHQELSGDPQYAAIALVCVTLRTPVHFVHMEQKLTTTPQHNREHNHTLCPTAPSAHASYYAKAMGAITQNRRGRPTATP